ncbi:hypothetical protein EDB85DRAFT_1403082 [Lactarius pseudohatsudake]|nr:hypothetical protein EDB85DRAFT_1403082 [Lactarius pseudohatsudake]
MSTPTPTSAPADQATDISSPGPLQQSGTLSSGAGPPWRNQEEKKVSLSNIWGADAQFTDESSHLFSLYLSFAEKHDKEQTENWKAGADGILVFTGLFAAALATFVIDSYKYLLPDRDTGKNTVALLAQISQQLSNGSQISAQDFIAPLPPFQPSTSAIWVNALWFLSLVVSLFCALLATLQQRWARRYLHRTQTQCAVHKRARLRSFFSEGVERFHLAFAVEAIPALLHISVFLFLTGLVISLFTIHHTIAYIILAATVAGGLVYTMITVMPVFYHNSPYHSPLSALAWDVPRKIARIFLSAFHYIVQHTGSTRADSVSSLTTKILECKKRLSVSMDKAAEDTADKQHWSIDARALSWTLDKSDEESELEKFIAGVPKFTRSTKVKDPMAVLKSATIGNRIRPSLYRNITTLLINALDPDLLPTYKELPESVQQRRIGICLEALYLLPGAIEKILRRVSDTLNDDQIRKKVRRGLASFLGSEESWHMAQRFSKACKHNKTPDWVIIAAQCMATVIASRVRLPEWDVKTRSTLFERLGIQNTSDLNLHGFYLKALNHFLANTVLEFIHVVDTDILYSTVRIVKHNQEHFKDAAEVFRDEFRALFHVVEIKVNDLNANVNVDDPESSKAVQENANKLLSELASVLDPAPGNGSTPTPPAAQTGAPQTVTGGSTAPVTPMFPVPQVPSPPPGDLYIPIPETPSGESYPLVPMFSPGAYPDPPYSATLPSHDTTSESV